MSARKIAASHDLATGDFSFPAVRDIAGHLHFSPDKGRIWLEDQRMVLMNAESFRALRSELVASLGLEAAQRLIERMGYVAGSRDAAFAKRLRSEGSVFDAFVVGPQLHALKGMAEIELQQFHMDVSTGQIQSEFIFRDSFEVEDPPGESLLARQGVCWMLTGYASGYSSAFMGKRILVREVECRARGDEQCRAIAKPAEAWELPDADPVGASMVVSQTDAALSASGPKADQKKASRAVSAVVGSSTAFNNILHQIDRVAPTRATVLLLGESGVGKSLFAREVHDRSPRRLRPFISVNCAAIPNELIESELFGAERGAYTGANASREGRFEIADGGTLFLDEIATLSLTAQGKLLKVLQTGEFERLGSPRPRHADVRVVAATNVDLARAIKDGTFRLDLFYRLNVFPIRIPPLRERRDDIPILIGHYLQHYSRMHQRNLRGLTPAALGALLEHDWPGNVRELENVIERGVILAEEAQPLERSHLFASHVPAELFELDSTGDLVEPQPDSDEAGAQVRDSVDAWLKKGDSLDLQATEDRIVLASLARADGNVSRAARTLQVTRAQLDYRIKKIRSREDPRIN